ncbi:hypothetical protein MPH_11054 [Macrophomina phaseolina MS6]|uniref:Uncharacterized protein n=1 Tax=Macrophomina phaseolina (strain MS6) TaxID=1126212 RepID=K2QNT6_MACPH|nr:hypothetical protein MPH_11054 [Macrophomina phaseolina MS6]
MEKEPDKGSIAGKRGARHLQSSHELTESCSCAPKFNGCRTSSSVETKANNARHGNRQWLAPSDHPLDYRPDLLLSPFTPCSCRPAEATGLLRSLLQPASYGVLGAGASGADPRRQKKREYSFAAKRCVLQRAQRSNHFAHQE